MAWSSRVKPMTPCTWSGHTASSGEVMVCLMRGDVPVFTPRGRGSRYRHLEHLLHHPPCGEVFLHERPRSQAVALVVAVGVAEAPSRLGKAPEAEQPLGVGEEPAPAGVLHHGRLAARKEAEGPVADPGVLEPDAGWLRTAELSP